MSKCCDVCVHASVFWHWQDSAHQRLSCSARFSLYNSLGAVGHNPMW